MVFATMPAYHTFRNSEKYLELYKQRTDSVIYMKLIFIIMFKVHIYTNLVFKIFHKHKKLISMLYLCSYIAAHKERIFACETIGTLEKEIVYYATIEKRRKRNNHLEMFMDVFDYQIIN